MDNTNQTLILTSSGQFVAFNSDLVNQYLPKPIGKSKIAYITTAADKVDNRNYIGIHKHKMDELNWDYTEIDITGKSEAELEKILSDFDMIMVEGGNTFYLLKSIRESGFDKVVKKLMKKGVVYIGSSAGSYVACPSMIMAAWSSKHNFDRCGITDFSAMNLVPFLIWAHFNTELKDLLKEKSKGIDLPIKTLTDDQALVIRNGKVELIQAESQH